MKKGDKQQVETKQLNANCNSCSPVYLYTLSIIHNSYSTFKISVGNALTIKSLISTRIANAADSNSLTIVDTLLLTQMLYPNHKNATII